MTNRDELRLILKTFQREGPQWQAVDRVRREHNQVCLF